MISNKTLKEYEFKTIENYFDYIIDSQINGNHSQVKNLFKKLSNEQKRLFFNYIVQFDRGHFDISGIY